MLPIYILCIKLSIEVKFKIINFLPSIKNLLKKRGTGDDEAHALKFKFTVSYSKFSFTFMPILQYFLQYLNNIIHIKFTISYSVPNLCKQNWEKTVTFFIDINRFILQRCIKSLT